MALAQYTDTFWFPDGRLAACTPITIYPMDSNIPAALYADECGTQRLPNPLRTNDKGILTFWAQEGRYWAHVDGKTFPIQVGGTSCITSDDVAQAIAQHTQANDPHGDRAYSDQKLLEHEAQTRGVHGIPDTSLLENKAGAQQKANAVKDAAVAEAVAISEQCCTQVQANLDAHAARTLQAHGIADTSQLVTRDELPTNTPQQADLDAAREAAIAAAATDATHKADAVRAAADACCAQNAAALQALRTTYEQHLADCHTLTIITDGVTAQPGWAVELAELRSVGGVNHAFIRLNRTGGDLVGKGPDFVNENGKHEEGNIVPDLLIAQVTEPWQPPQTYLPFSANSYGHGAVRVHGNGDIYLTDWMTNNVIQDGYLLRFGYTFLRQPACQPTGA